MAHLTTPATVWKYVESAATKSAANLVMLDLEDSIPRGKEELLHQGRENVVRAMKELDWGRRLKFFRPRGLALDPGHEDIQIIVATVAFGMGIDKSNVRFVVHTGAPKSLEHYQQETGRAGRDGREGRCVTFYSYKDIEKLEKFMKGKPVAEQEVGKQLLNETVGYAETSVCRRRVLLNYFGETYKESNCTNCDNCNHPKKSFDGREEILTVLETVQAVKEKFAMDHIVNVITGKAENAVKLHQHDQLDQLFL